MIVSISALAVLRELKHSIGERDWFSGLGKHGRIPKTRRDGTKPSGPIISLIALTESRRICLSVNSGCYFDMMFKMRQSG